ncbi:MAG: DoxX family protein [Chitinophagaceae bacterium]|nr:DoxX family protein [Chitinophagaceae bacterium]
MRRFPFINVKQSILLLRFLTAAIFILHAVFRIIYSTSGQFADFLNSKGLLFGLQIVWLITIFEIAGGLLLIAGKYVQLIAAGFILLLLTGIVLIHFSLGWFVGEHGTGGCEYSVILIGCLLVIAASHRENSSVHNITQV